MPSTGATVARRRQPAPPAAESLPDWVIKPPCTGIPVGDAFATEYARFMQWRTARQAWLAANAPGLSLLDLDRERQRRWPAVDRRRRPGRRDAQSASRHEDTGSRSASASVLDVAPDHDHREDQR